MFEITFADMDATPDFQTGRQSLEGFDDFCIVGFRLLCGPVLDGISPDVFKISPASGDRPYFRGLFAICRASASGMRRYRRVQVFRIPHQ